jgi:cytoskeletal protein CcmA (bactofilin family)
MISQAFASSEEPVRRTNIPKDNWLGFVGDVLKFTGEVTFKSTLRIDGHFCGQVKSEGGTLIVSSGAQITRATIDVGVAKINGTVEGDINASDQVTLGHSASVTGNILAGALIVEKGAVFNGSCRLNKEQAEESGAKTAAPAAFAASKK